MRQSGCLNEVEACLVIDAFAVLDGCATALSPSSAEFRQPSTNICPMMTKLRLISTSFGRSRPLVDRIRPTLGLPRSMVMRFTGLTSF